jgi:hypothetical protein
VAAGRGGEDAALVAAGAAGLAASAGFDADVEVVDCMAPSVGFEAGAEAGLPQAASVMADNATIDRNVRRPGNRPGMISPQDVGPSARRFANTVL